ncbi:MAG: dihydroorotase [Clostridia bacterium]|nr:dihydroorotase [Clostridia bacterium]
MNFKVQKCNVYKNRRFSSETVSVKHGSFSAFDTEAEKVFSFPDCVIFPGFIDAHVHLREPGFSYKETIHSGTKACAAGGYTEVCSMPNLKPVPDSEEHLQEQLDIIARDAVIGVHPFGSITVGQLGESLSDLDGMAENCIGFSDDGKGVQDEEMMRRAMLKAKQLGKIISAHCEVNELLHGGYIHDGVYCKEHNHKGICSESEWKMIERDLRLAKETGCKYHVCHISTKESVELIRKAKAEGVDVTCETGPHYLVLCDKDLQEEGRFKMNPPLRSEEDKKALIEGILDGTIDMIATDHAPHSAEEKSKGLAGSMMGITGIETAFPIMYTHFVKTGLITLEKLMDLLHNNAKMRFGIGTDIEENAPADFTVFDLNQEFTIDSKNFVSMGKATPFDGWEVYGKCLLTVKNGNIVWEAER